MKLVSNNIWDLLCKKLSGESSIKENKLFDEWRQVEDNEQLYHSLSGITLDFNDNESIEVKDEIFSRTFNKILSNNTSKRNKIKKKLIVFSVAASLALLISLAGNFFLYNNDLKAESSLVVFSSPLGISDLVLPDSSVVTLNAGTKISYRTDFNVTDRRVTLEGEAFFDVSKNPEKPFILSSGELELKVLGTTFNVSAYPKEKQIVASLLTGSVEISDNRNHNIWTLTPRQAAILNKETSEIRFETVDPEYVTGWMSGEILFKKQPFNNICNMLERKFGYTIEIKNTKIEKKLFTGKFLNNESLSQILDIIQVNIPFSYTFEDSTVIIH